MKSEDRFSPFPRPTFGNLDVSRPLGLMEDHFQCRSSPSPASHGAIRIAQSQTKSLANEAANRPWSLSPRERRRLARHCLKKFSPKIVKAIFRVARRRSAAQKLLEAGVGS